MFDECYAENPLVNVLCLGAMPVERLILGKASGVGNLAVLVGSSTGRDGIGGVSVLASAGFGDAEAEQAKRPSVQVGDPFEEKRLIEACLELLDNDLVVGVQDLGGAGLTCATSETASKGGVGMDVFVSEVPQREPGMEAFEVMTSESQERMLAIVTPEALDGVLAICAKWEVRASVVGTVTGTGRLRILDQLDGEVLADMPAASLEEEAPRYDRPMAEPAGLAARRADDPSVLGWGPGGPEADLLALLRSSGDTSWVWQQYDHQLFLNTVEGPGGDAAVLRLGGPGIPRSGRGLALSTDGNGRWCDVDPRAGTAMVVAESALNVACAGAVPKALVDCMNFGNPEHPVVMWQFSEAIDGMGEACRALGIPVIGGNVSFYNESKGRDIDPSPIVGVLGIIESLDRRPPGAVLVDGAALLMLGDASPERLGVGGSRWADVVHGHRGGALPPLDLAAHKTLLALVANLVTDDVLVGIHDVADGGLAVALAELAVRSDIGATVRLGVPGGASGGGSVAGHMFSEAGSRVVVVVTPDRVDEVVARAVAAGIPIVVLGSCGGARLVVDGLVDLPLDELGEVWRGAIRSHLVA